MERIEAPAHITFSDFPVSCSCPPLLTAAMACPARTLKFIWIYGAWTPAASRIRYHAAPKLSVNFSGGSP